MHSKDFLQKDKEKIEGKTQSEWEKELHISSMLDHLEVLGWKDYQWNYESRVELARDEKNTCFAEFFSPFYNGFLRGDSRESVKDAVEQCLNRAQAIASCETKTGHYYNGKGGYEKGMVECIHCGFHGHSPQYETLQSHIKQLNIHVRSLQEKQSLLMRNAEKAGVKFNFFSKIVEMPTPPPFEKAFLLYEKVKKKEELIALFSTEEKAQTYMAALLQETPAREFYILPMKVDEEPTKNEPS